MGYDAVMTGNALLMFRRSFQRLSSRQKCKFFGGLSQQYNKKLLQNTSNIPPINTEVLSQNTVIFDSHTMETTICAQSASVSHYKLCSALQCCCTYSSIYSASFPECLSFCLGDQMPHTCVTVEMLDNSCVLLKLYPVQSFDIALKVSPAGIGGLACRPSLIYETALTKVPMANENYMLQSCKKTC